MRSSASLIIAAFLAGSVVAAENRPRIYYPRQVNRRYTNETVTTTSSSSKRQASTTGDDNGSGNPLLNLGGPTSGGGSLIDIPDLDVGLGPIQVGNPTTPGALANSTATNTNTRTDITISPTVIPTTTGSSNSAAETTSENTGLGGLVSSILGGGDNDSTSTSASAVITAPSDTATRTATDTGSIVPTNTNINTNTAPSSADPTTTGGGLGLSLTLPSLTLLPSTLLPTLLPSTLLPSTLLPTLLPDPTTTNVPTTQPTVIPTTAPAAVTNTNPTNPASSSGGLGLTLPTLLPTLLNPTTAPQDPTTAPQQPTGGANATAPSSTGLGLSLPISIPSITLLPPASSSTEAPVVTPSSSIDLLPTVSSPLLSIPPITSIIPTLNPNGTDIISTSIPTDTAITIPTDTSFIPTGGSTSAGPVPTDSTTAGPITTGSNSTITEPTSTGPAATPTVTPTVIPGNSTSSDPVPTPSSFSSAPATIQPNTTAPALTSSELPQTTPSSTVAPITSSTFTGTSVVPTATITDSSQSWLPTTILMQPSSTLSTGGVPTSATGLPSNLPQALTPWEVPPVQPEDTTLIQVSFLYGVNYQFLVSQPMAAAQLFQHLPEALAFAGGFNKDKAVMHSIVPYDTLSTLGYITSQALVYHPTELIPQLAIDIKNPNSIIYQNPVQIVSNLTNEINPAIDITLGSGLGGVAGGENPSNSSPTNSGPNSGDPFNNSGGSGDNTSSTQKAQTAGIALGSAAVASAYGAAMFILARRYKRKRQGHKRNSSISSNSEMRQTASPALMGGALLSRDFTGYGGVQGNPNVNANTRHSQGSGHNSARTAIISAPVAAENSLGWN